MNNQAYFTSSSNVTIFCALVPFRGQQVLLTHCTEQYCPHDIGVVHHYDDEGRHYCPTGFIMCYLCGGMGDEPGEPECTLWGELPS